MTRNELLRSLVGKPYAENAKGPDAYDCWHLVRHVRAALFQDVLPDFDVPEKPSLLWLAHMFKNADERKNWRQVIQQGIVWNPGADGNLVLMSKATSAVHIGIWLKAERGILHSVETDGVVFQDIPVIKANGWGHLRYFERV